MNLDAPEVQRDITRFQIDWGNVERTIGLHRKLEESEGLTEPWNEWEYPRRLAYLRKRRAALGDWKAKLL